MDEIKKNKIKEVMVKILKKNVNYTNCSIEAILNENKNMWLALEEAGLTEGLNFKSFQEHAVNQAMMVNIKNMFGI